MMTHTSTAPTLAGRFWSTLIWLSLLGFIFAVNLSGQALAASQVDFVELAFYEGGSDDDPPEWESTEMKTTFDGGRVRYIYTIVNLKNRLWKKRGQDVKLHIRYYHSDGTLFGEPTIDYHVPADWEYADLWTGWGWDTANKWEPDFYKVEVWLDNRIKIGEGFFHVKAHASAQVPKSTGSVEFDRIGFYESGDGGSDNPPEGWEDPRMKNSFPKSSTRYIYTMVSLKNLQWKSREQDVVIHVRYYYSNGELFGDPVIEYTVPADWEFAELWNGWGWPDAGNWKADRYRVELWLDNRKKIGEGFFTVY